MSSEIDEEALIEETSRATESAWEEWVKSEGEKSVTKGEYDVSTLGTDGDPSRESDDLYDFLDALVDAGADVWQVRNGELYVWPESDPRRDGVGSSDGMPIHDPNFNVTGIPDEEVLSILDEHEEVSFLSTPDVSDHDVPEAKSDDEPDHHLGPAMKVPSWRLEEDELRCDVEGEVVRVDRENFDQRSTCPECGEDIDAQELIDRVDKSAEAVADGVLSNGHAVNQRGDGLVCERCEPAETFVIEQTDDGECPWCREPFSIFNELDEKFDGAVWRVPDSKVLDPIRYDSEEKAAQAAVELGFSDYHRSFDGWCPGKTATSLKEAFAIPMDQKLFELSKEDTGLSEGWWELAIQDGEEGYRNSESGEFVPASEADVDIMADIREKGETFYVETVTASEESRCVGGFSPPDLDSPERMKTVGVVESPSESVETVERRIHVNGMAEVPDDVVAKHDDTEGLYYRAEVRKSVVDQMESSVDVPDTVLANFEKVEGMLASAYRNHVWADDLAKAPRTWQGDEDVEAEVKSWVAEVVEEDNPMYDDFDDIPHLASMNVHREIKDSLTQPQGWSIASVVKRLQNNFDWLDADNAEKIARQEIGATLNKAKATMYRAKEKEGETFMFKWVGPDDESTSFICRVIKEEVNRRGGAVSYDVLVDILSDVSSKYEDRGGTPHRVGSLIPHFQCRHTIERAAGYEKSFAKVYKDATWYPYEGDRGGSGWYSPDIGDDGKRIYSDEPPGGEIFGDIGGVDPDEFEFAEDDVSVDEIEQGEEWVVFNDEEGKAERIEVEITIGDDVYYSNVDDAGGGTMQITQFNEKALGQLSEEAQEELGTGNNRTVVGEFDTDFDADVDSDDLGNDEVDLDPVPVNEDYDPDYDFDVEVSDEEVENVDLNNDPYDEDTGYEDVLRRVEAVKKDAIESGFDSMTRIANEVGRELARVLDSDADNKLVAEVCIREMDEGQAAKATSKAMMEMDGVEAETDSGLVFSVTANSTQVDNLFEDFIDENPEFVEAAESMGYGIRDNPSDTALDDFGELSGSTGSSPELWQLAFEMTGNTNPHRNFDGDWSDDVEVEFDAEAGGIPEEHQYSDEQAEMMEAYVEFVQDRFADLHGEEATVYRGTTSSRKVQKNRFMTVIKARNPEESDMEHRACESWTLNPLVARDFAYPSADLKDHGAVLVDNSFSPADFFGGYLSGTGFSSELEVLAMHEEEEVDYDESDREVIITGEAPEAEAEAGHAELVEEFDRAVEELKNQ